MKLYDIEEMRERKMQKAMERTKTSIFEVAKAFLSFEPMTHKKLQKLCYYSYTWYYTLYDKKLFDNRFEAWVHGPVDPILYDVYKTYGWREIPQVKLPDGFQSEILDFATEVYQSYGHLTGDQLEYLTHMELPWQKARGDIPEYMPSNALIDDEDIKQYCLKVLKDGQIE